MNSLAEIIADSISDLVISSEVENISVLPISVFHIADTCSYNKVTVEGAAASRVFFHLKAEAVRMGE